MPRGLYHCFSPEGARIAYSSKGSIHVANLDGAVQGSFKAEFVSGLAWIGHSILVFQATSRQSQKCRLAAIDILSGGIWYIAPSDIHGTIANGDGDGVFTYLGHLDGIFGLHQLNVHDQSSRKITILD